MAENDLRYNKSEKKRSGIAKRNNSYAHTADVNSEENEDFINQWYERSLSDLNTRQLRDEQYRRKRAMLRVEYWTKMDKLKNNATPTVVSCT